MVKCLTHGLRDFNGAVQRRLATLMVTILISPSWQLSSKVELRRIFDVCNRWANSGSHEFVKKSMVRYMRPHGRFAHCSCKNAVRQPPVLASCIEIYYFLIQINAKRKPCFPAFHRKKSRGNFRLQYSTLQIFVL